MTEEGLTCLGYYVVRLFEPPAKLSGALLPERILTLSPCLTDLFPDSWALDWVTCAAETRAASAARLGIPPTDLPRVSARVGELFNSGDFAWPNVWRRLDVARSVTRELLQESGDLALVGLGMPREFVTPLLSELAPQSQEGAPGVYLAALANEALSAGGSLAGWEVLGFERGAGCHSWLCNAIHMEAATRIERFPGALGLLQSEADAREVLRMMAEDPEKAEPATWVPAALVQYEF